MDLAFIASTTNWTEIRMAIEKGQTKPITADVSWVLYTRQMQPEPVKEMEQNGVAYYGVITLVRFRKRPGKF